MNCDHPPEHVYNSSARDGRMYCRKCTQYSEPVVWPESHKAEECNPCHCEASGTDCGCPCHSEEPKDNRPEAVLDRVLEKTGVIPKPPKQKASEHAEECDKRYSLTCQTKNCSCFCHKPTRDYYTKGEIDEKLSEVAKTAGERMDFLNDKIDKLIGLHETTRLKTNADEQEFRRELLEFIQKHCSVVDVYDEKKGWAHWEHAITSLRSRFLKP